MISLRLNQQTEAIRRDFLAWLESNPAPVLPGKVELERFVEVSRAWQKKLAHDHWIGLHWPEAYGGRGLSIVDEAVVQECLALHRSPQLINLFGLTMVGPVLIEHGTEEQKKRFLGKILSADEIWCQGFSEPGAGSDLGAIRTKAELKDDSWSLSGQKIWTSFAHHADWCFILARNSSEGKTKFDGLTYFLMSMRESGIDIRPLQQITGEKEFNELFLDSVKVANDRVVGKVGEGWNIAISTLMYERVVLTFARHLQSEQLLVAIREYFSENGGSERDLEEFGRLVAKSMAVRALALSHLLTYEGKNKKPGPEGSLDKLGWSETFQEICKFALSLGGPERILTSGVFPFAEGMFQHQYLYSRGRTIAAGTSEIQRNIIAERVLGLPREEKRKTATGHAA